MIEKISIQNASEQTLAGMIHKPLGQGPFPAALVLHGYLASKDEAQIVAFSQALAQAGILALRFDTYGIKDSGGTLEKHYRVSQMVSDTSAWFDYLATRSDVIPDRIGLCGHSLGASVAIIHAAMNPSVSACCAVQPSTKITRLEGNRTLQRWAKKGFLVEELGESLHKKRIKIPYDFGLDADTWDAAEYAAKVKCPMALMYGTEDVAVTPDTVKMIYQHSPHTITTLIELKETDHDFKYNPEKLKWVTLKVVAFMKESLCGRQANE